MSTYGLAQIPCPKRETGLALEKIEGTLIPGNLYFQSRKGLIGSFSKNFGVNIGSGNPV